ncbi:hypothetical protein HMPREF1434_00615 [Helicobacter pylori GAMchJs124i]|nr:hypothetical protein HMPREF1434_00615 [Helicobacter pylori GAMchJs124i]
MKSIGKLDKHSLSKNGSYKNSPTLFDKSLLMILEYPFKKNFYQFA